jgi:hypothetical protein
MTDNARAVLRWSPRLLGIGTAIFLGLFALDAFAEGHGFWAAVPAYLVHLLPSALLLVVVALAWRRPWIGAAAFVGCAALYASSTRRFDWILLIGGPLAFVGLLYVASWQQDRGGHAGA